MILTKGKGGISGILGGLDVRFIYYVVGDSNTKNIREFLKEYNRFYEKNNLDTGDQGIFMCSGKTDKGLFRDLKKALVRDRDIASTISTKTLPGVTVERRKKVVEEERIKEKITEREIMRSRVTEERISVRGLVGKIKKFKPLTRPKREAARKHADFIFASVLSGCENSANL